MELFFCCQQRQELCISWGLPHQPEGGGCEGGVYEHSQEAGREGEWAGGSGGKGCF